MTCREVSEFLGDYFDNTLPWRVRWAFALHLVLCRECRRYLSTYSATVKAVDAVRRESQSDETPAPAELVQAILAARGQTDRGASLDAAERPREDV